MYKDSTCMVGSGILNMELSDTKEEKTKLGGRGMAGAVRIKPFL